MIVDVAIVAKGIICKIRIGIRKKKKERRFSVSLLYTILIRLLLQRVPQIQMPLSLV
jgi:hypothetical protein